MLHNSLLLTYLRLSSILGLHWYLHSDLDDALHLLQAKLPEFFLRFPPCARRVFSAPSRRCKCCARCIPYLKDSRERPALGRKVRIELIRAAKLGRHANKNCLAHHHYRARRHAHLFISIRLCRACVREARNYTWKGGDRPGQFRSNPHGSCSSWLILNTYKQFSYNTLTL